MPNTGFCWCSSMELTEKYVMEAAVSERTAKNKIKFAKDSNIIKAVGKQYVLVDDTI